MDAEQIVKAYLARQMPPVAQLQHGPVLCEIRVRKVYPYGLTFMGSYIPDFNARVKIHIDTMAVEGIMSARTDVRGAILFVRPAALLR